MWLSRDCTVSVYVNIFVYVYINIIIYVFINITVYIFVIIYIINTTYFIYFIINLFKRILYSICIVKKEWKGFKGETTVWTVHAISRYFFTFFNFLCKNICFFQEKNILLKYRDLEKNWKFFNFFEISNYLYKTRMKTLWPL